MNYVTPNREGRCHFVFEYNCLMLRILPHYGVVQLSLNPI